MPRAIIDTTGAGLGRTGRNLIVSPPLERTRIANLTGPSSTAQGPLKNTASSPEERHDVTDAPSGSHRRARYPRIAPVAATPRLSCHRSDPPNTDPKNARPLALSRTGIIDFPEMRCVTY